MHQPLDPEIIASFHATVVECAESRPVDGACLTTAPRITKTLVSLGLPAHTVRVAGWLDDAGTVLAFLHLATRCHGMILDGTARQFNLDLPSAWIATERDYLHDLATATHLAHATILK